MILPCFIPEKIKPVTFLSLGKIAEKPSMVGRLERGHGFSFRHQSQCFQCRSCDHSWLNLGHNFNVSRCRHKKKKLAERKEPRSSTAWRRRRNAPQSSVPCLLVSGRPKEGSVKLLSRCAGDSVFVWTVLQSVNDGGHIGLQKTKARLGTALNWGDC